MTCKYLWKRQKNKNKEEIEKKRQEKTMLTKKQLFTPVPKKKKKVHREKIDSTSSKMIRTLSAYIVKNYIQSPMKDGLVV